MNFLRIKIISASLATVFALFMFLGPRNYILSHQQSKVDFNINHTEQYIKKSITYLINEKKQRYLNTSDIIFSDKKILNALKNKNRAAFYKHVNSYYDRTKKRDPDFWGLHIILPNNMSFIRVHKPQVSDKLIKKGQKPLIDHVNETRQFITSFDSGKFGYFLRVVTPIFSNTKEYLGIAEFSVKVDSLTQYIKDNFNYDALFLVKNLKNKNFLNISPKTPSGLTKFKSTNNTLFTDFSLSDTKTQQPFHHNIIDYKNKKFSTISIKLSDSAILVVAFDVTKVIAEYRAFEKNIAVLNTIVIFIFLSLWFIATKYYLKNIIQVSYELDKSHDIISENVIYSNTDLSGKITEVSDAFCDISGYTQKQLIGSTHNITSHPDTQNSTYKNLWHTIKENKVWNSEVKNLNANGDSYWLDVTISPKFNSQHQKIGYMSISQNITDKKIIETNSITDSLCGIYNRRHFDELFIKIITAAKRKNELLCFLIMDLDYFKEFNDTYGHQMGDQALKSVAQCLNKSLTRGDDYCFRLGGEEFGAIFKADSKEMALNYTNMIRINIENLKIAHSSSKVSPYLTASFGLICKNAKDIKNTDEIYKEADDLLYKAKSLNRNNVIINA